MVKKKPENTNLLSEQDILNAKFHACMGVGALLINQWSKSDYKFMESEFSSKKFNELLVEFKMQEYDVLLMNFFIWQLNQMKTANINNSKYEAFKSKVEYEREAYNELIELLHLLLSSEKGNLTSISFSKQRGNRVVDNKINLEFFLKDLNIIESLIKEFEERKYNVENLSLQEAKEEIYKRIDSRWIENWMINHEFRDKSNQRLIDYDEVLADLEYNNCTSGEQILGEDIINKIIHDYSESHIIKREVTPEYIETLVLQQIKPKRKKGAREKKEIKTIMQSLSYLARIDKFLDSPDEIQDIEQIKLEREECEFIFDILDFFKLLDGELKSSKPKYIRSRLNYIKSPYTPEFFKRIRTARFAFLKSQITLK